MARAPDPHAIKLSRIVPGAVNVGDIESAKTIPADVVSKLTDHERHMFDALQHANKPGTALAITLATYRGWRLPPGDPRQKRIDEVRRRQAPHLAR